MGVLLSYLLGASLTEGVSGECLGERQDADEAVSFVCSTTAFLIEHRILLNFGNDCAAFA